MPNLITSALIDQILDAENAEAVRTLIGAIAELSQDATPQLGGDLDGQGHEIHNFDNAIVVESGTAVTLGSSHRGRKVVFTSASPVTVTVTDTLLPGWVCVWIQAGAGAISFSASGSMVLNNVDAHTSSAGQYASGTIEVYAVNASLLSGGTA